MCDSMNAGVGCFFLLQGIFPETVSPELQVDSLPAEPNEQEKLEDSIDEWQKIMKKCIHRDEILMSNKVIKVFKLFSNHINSN